MNIVLVFPMDVYVTCYGFVICVFKPHILETLDGIAIKNSNTDLYLYSSSFTCRKCKGNIGDAVEQEENLCDEVETVREFTYLGDWVSAGGGCKAAVTA